jgi:hypothetical protein
VAKTVGGVTTHYVRHAPETSGRRQRLAVRRRAVRVAGHLLERRPEGTAHLPSRLGVYKVPAGGLQTDRDKLTLGRREYELRNHLGND